jgi:ribonuclease HI
MSYGLLSLFSTRVSTEMVERMGLVRGAREPNDILDCTTHCASLCVLETEMPDLIAYVDGGSHGSPGPSGIGVLIEKPDGEMIRIAKWIGHHDNNVAEYAALLEALQHAHSLNATSLSVYSDSELVVKQMTGEYLCRSPRLYSLHWMCRKLARTLTFCISHIPREQNQEANRLANYAVRFRREPLPELE